VLDFGSAKVDWCVITLVQSLTQSLRQHQWDSNARYRDNPHFLAPLRLEKVILTDADSLTNMPFLFFAPRLTCRIFLMSSVLVDCLPSGGKSPLAAFLCSKC
jgi:hypothetical protein